MVVLGSPAPLGSPQPVITLPPLNDIADDNDDTPVPGDLIGFLGSYGYPALIFGAGSFSNQYNTDEHLSSALPLRIVRLALRYGVKAFDTSPYYGPSEIVLGTALKTLEPIFPRSSYQLMTKCGRYGADASGFDYSPSTIRASVERSLRRFHTDYLDVVYLHDVEFVCSPIDGPVDGHHESAITTEQSIYGLNEEAQGKVLGEGDQKILDAFQELSRLKADGKIKKIGITGYPLPVLLRIALLILYNPPYKPVDQILSYSHLTLQNTVLEAYLPLCRDRSHVAEVINASPLSMALLTPKPPSWHPAPVGLRDACAKIASAASAWPGGLPDVSLGFAFRKTIEHRLPLVVGFSQLKDVHESVRIWREVKEGKSEGRRLAEDEATKSFITHRFKDFSWASP